MATNWKEIDLDFIIAYCKEHNEIEWLKATTKEEVIIEVYPRVRVIRYDENGNPVLKKNGKPAKVSVPDKTKPFTKKKVKKSFVQVKHEFCEKFMPDILPKRKAKKETFWEKIEALPDHA